MKNLILSLMIISSSTAMAKVEAKFEKLRDSQIECDVVAAVEFQNGKMIKKLKNEATVMKSFNQDGGADYTDAKCFLTSVVDVKGEESKIAFGCIELDSKRIKKYSAEKLIIKRKEYGEVIEIDFKSGKGSHIVDTRSCDWGRECVETQAEVQFRNCVMK